MSVSWQGAIGPEVPPRTGSITPPSAPGSNGRPGTGSRRGRFVGRCFTRDPPPPGHGMGSDHLAERRSAECDSAEAGHHDYGAAVAAYIVSVPVLVGRGEVCLRDGPLVGGADGVAGSVRRICSLARMGVPQDSGEVTAASGRAL